MNLYPKAYFSSVLDITIQFLIKHKIKALILDVDNTLIDKDRNLSEETIAWAKDLRGQGTKMYILSNTNDKHKVEEVAQKLALPFEYFALKPFKKGFKRVQKAIQEKPEQIAVVGDQIFTDVIGGNRLHMFTILVDPISPKDYWYTAWKRPIEEKIKRKIKSEMNFTITK